MGKAKGEPLGALERFIDYHHYRQTIVYILLDNEGRAAKICEKLCQAKSKAFSDRHLINPEHIYLWENKSIEFSNFSDEEIALAMTNMGERRYNFEPFEVEECRKEHLKRDSPTLSHLFFKKLNYKLSKKTLLKVLVDLLVANPSAELNANEEIRRPLLRQLKKIVNLAARNYQPITREIWERNQASGFFG